MQAKIEYSVWGVASVTNYRGYEGRGDISYTGKERDATGLYYFNARYYDPSVGRFITEDPTRNGLNWFVYCNNNPLSRTDPTGLKYIEAAQIYGDEFYSAETNSIRSPTDLNLQFAEKVREYVGAKYGSGTTITMADCSGVGIGALRAMGVNVERLNANGMAHAEFIMIYEDVNIDRQGRAGVLNFYSYNTENDHVNYGVGKLSDEQCNQIVDASDPKTTWEVIHNGDSRQTPPYAVPGEVNKTYAPFSTKTNPSSQGYILWKELF